MINIYGNSHHWFWCEFSLFLMLISNVMKICKNRNCNNEVEGRKQYCCDRCQYWEKQLQKQDDVGLMPKNKRTNKFFWSYSHSSYTKGQGKRSGGMVCGALTGIPFPNFTIENATDENLKKHSSKNGVYVAVFGDGSRLLKEAFEKHGYHN